MWKGRKGNEKVVDSRGLFSHFRAVNLSGGLVIDVGPFIHHQRERERESPVGKCAQRSAADQSCDLPCAK